MLISSFQYYRHVIVVSLIFVEIKTRIENIRPKIDKKLQTNGGVLVWRKEPFKKFSSKLYNGIAKVRVWY